MAEHQKSRQKFEKVARDLLREAQRLQDRQDRKQFMQKLEQESKQKIKNLGKEFGSLEQQPQKLNRKMIEYL